MTETTGTEAVRSRTARRLRRHSGTITGAAVLSLIALAVLFGSAVHDVDPQYLDYPAKNQGMSLEHPLGTDNLGRDTLARMLAGGRISLAVGTAAMVRPADAVHRPVPGAAGAAVAARQHHVVSRLAAVRPRPGSRDLHPDRGRHRHHELDADRALSFLGLGFPSDFPTWGRLLYDGVPFLTLTPARVIWPGVAISLTVLSVNYVGDGLRDALDPHANVGG